VNRVLLAGATCYLGRYIHNEIAAFAFETLRIKPKITHIPNWVRVVILKMVLKSSVPNSQIISHNLPNSRQLPVYVFADAEKLADSKNTAKRGFNPAILRPGFVTTANFQWNRQMIAAISLG
jgi:hypothetical protein